MQKQTFLMTPTMRPAVIEAVKAVPFGWYVELRPPTRSLEQNKRLWAMLRDISQQVDWYGQRLSDEEWKDVFSAAMKKQKVVPGLDGGFVVCGQRTSQMTKAEMSDMQTLMEAFGAERNVKWTEPEREHA